MKRMSRITYLVLSAIIGLSTVTPVNAAEYRPETENVGSTVSGNDIDMIELESAAIVNGTIPADWYAEFPNCSKKIQLYNSSQGINASASSYDPRELNRVSAVRRQTGGTCWLYAAVAACESNLIHKRYEDNTVDLSELQLLYFAKNGFTDKLSNYTRNTLWDSLTMREYMSKGSGPITVAYQLAQWCGPVSEERAPIPSFPAATLTERIEYVANTTLDSSMAQEAEYHLCGTRKLSGNIQNPTSVLPYVKELIATYGGVTASFYAGATHEKILPNLDTTHYCAYDKGVNHAIELVGWDDEFSAANFKKIPPGDGAWLCKNSDGITSTTNGFLWISYYDRTLCDFLAFDLEEADKYENIYGYRDNVTNELYYSEEINNTTIYHSMSVFEASAYEDGVTETVDAVLVDALYANKEYKITLYANPVVEGGRLVSYTGKSDTRTLHTDYAGMYKMDFSDAPLLVVDGNTFGIYVETNGNINSATQQICKAYTNKAEEFVQVESVHFADSEVVLTENDEKQILPTVLPETATKKECYFSSSDETVAVVDADGTVCPVGFGECDILATSYDGCATGRYHVVVKCTGLSLANNQVYTGETLQMLPISLNDIQGITADKVTWAVSNTSIATINNNGVLTGKKAGEVTVTIKLKENEAITAACKVKVLQRAASMRVENVNEYGEMYLFEGDTAKIATTFAPADTSNKTLSYTVLGDGFKAVSVDKNGVITALESGRNDIEVKTLDGSELSQIITVDVLPRVTNINIDVNSGGEVRQNQKAYVTIDFWQDASYFQDKIKVSFSNPNAVKVEEVSCYQNYQFEMTVKEAGKLKITVTLDDKNKTSKSVTVNVKANGSGSSTGTGTGTGSKKVSSFTVNNLKYKVTGNNVTLTGTGAMDASVTIPSKVKYQGKSYNVTKIAARAFKGNTKLKTVTIPGSVTEIGASAFEKCTKLQTVTLNKGLLTIGNSAFRSCKELAKITIPASVSKIGTGAFQDCVKLNTVSFKSGSALTSLGNNAFSGCKALTKVTLPGKLTKVPQKAFYNCSSLKTVTIGENVTSIGASAFAGTAVAKVTIPAKVKTIGKNAFYNCSKLKTVTFKGNKVKTVGTKAFSKMNKEGSIKVPESHVKAYNRLLKGKYTKGVIIK